MNGDRTAEQYAESAAADASSANAAAQRATAKATEIANAALRMEQMGSRLERGLDDLRREVRKLASAVAVDRANAKTQPRHELASFTSTEWEDSPTGVHKIKKVKKSEWEAWQKERELSVDAQRWRKALNTSGKIALAITLVILGALIRHYLFGGH